MSLISKMDNETYEAVKACVCPYCAAKLPDRLIAYNENRWEHSIPGSSETFTCLATRFRNARYDPADEKERT